MGKIRAFIAIELPEDLKKELEKLQTKVKTNKPRIKWVSPNSIHLTLKFLGDVDPAAVDSITKAMTEAVKGVPPFELNVRHLGVFPNPQRVQVVWVGLDGQTDVLNNLYRSLEDKMTGIGFPTEKRTFTPHLTLARVGDEVLPDERKRFGELISNSKAEINYTVRAGGLSLMKSQLTPRGAIYTRLSFAKFDKNI